MIKTREQILNEAFIGKKPTDKLFGHWKDLVEFIINNPHTPHQREKCYEEFRKELCNVFGFSEVALIIIPYKEINAMTYPARFDDTDLTQLKDIFIVNNEWLVRVLFVDTYDISIKSSFTVSPFKIIAIN